MTDDTVNDSRLIDAADRLVASFADLDTEAMLRAARGGVVTVGGRPPARSARWLAAAAVVTVLVGGAVAFGASRAMRSDRDEGPSPVVIAPETTTPDSTAPSVSDPPATTAPAPTIDTVIQTTPSSVVEPTASVEATVPPTSGVPVGPNAVFVTTAGERRALIEVRDAFGAVGSFDLSCAAGLDCVVRSARVMGDTIWVAVADSEPGSPDAVVRSRIVSVTRSSGAIVEHLSLDGPAAVWSAGLGADGLLYAYLTRGPEPDQRELVSVEQGDVRVLATGVAGFRLSDDGRLLAVSFSNPPAGEQARFEITNLVDGTTNGFQTEYTNAGPAAWSPDGRALIVDEQWEQGTAWVVDPWSTTGARISGSESLEAPACFVSDRVVASRTWDTPYGGGDAQRGVVRLTSLDTGLAVGQLGDATFGDGITCHPDGSVSYLRRPLVEVELAPGLAELQPDDDAPVELVHLATDGTSVVRASGDLALL